MLSFDTFLALSAFAFVSSITPGPNNLMLMASGANFGFARTMPHLLGVGIGFAVMIVLVGVGLIQLFDRVPVSYQVLKVVSIAYLCYLAWKIATASAPGGTAAANAGAKPMNFLQAALFQWVNPKAWTMALTAITAYSPPDHGLVGVGVVAVVFGLINLPSIGVWAGLGTQLRRLLTNAVALRVFNVTAALLLLASLYPTLVSHHGP